MKIHEDPLFTFELESEPGILRFLWTEKTAHMTDEDFKRALSLYAHYAAKHRTSSLLVDVRNFHHKLGPEIGKWRSEVLVPRYEAAGVKKFAYVVGGDAPMPPNNSSMAAKKEAFETRYFRSPEEAEAWLRQKPSTMRFVMATYRLRTDNLDVAKAAIQNYVEQVHRNERETYSYQCFQSYADPTRFIHLMSFAHEEAEATHASSPFLKKFGEKLFPFCAEGPNYETLQLLNSSS